MITLGIETSCDETSLAILDGNTVLTNEIYSQDIHAAFGGVVPEMASRAHMDKIDALCASAFEKSRISPRAVGLIAVTDGPGLAGALLVGISFALGLHSAYDIDITGINHLEGHICSILLEHPAIPRPFLCMVVSGGHTSIYRVKDFGSYACLGKTIDDAAGEAFDKVGKMLGFKYPAGRSIENEAKMAPPGAPCIPFPAARMSSSALDFSFSGLKTAVKYFLRDKGPDFMALNRPLICTSLQESIVNALVANMKAASRQTGISTVAVVGGVACNGHLRKRISEAFEGSAFFPSPVLCTDNAAMIAQAGFERAKRKSLRFPRLDPSADLSMEKII
jgi:N6-L-threonylcarbamoyladenine synthase